MVRTMAARPSFPKDLEKKEYVTREQALFRARREALDSQIAVLRKQIQESLEEASALAQQLGAEERALKLQKEELAANERLLEQGYVQKTRLLALQRGVAEYEARHGERRAEVSKARQRASELEFRILAMRRGLLAEPLERFTPFVGKKAGDGPRWGQSPWRVTAGGR